MNPMNKILLYSISILTFLTILPYISNSTLEEARKSFQEVAYSYYMRGKNIQYYASKDFLFSPEEATEQNINYLVCSSFTMAVYLELLNVSTPYSRTHYFQYLKDNEGSPEIFAYSQTNGNNEFEMKYYSPTETDKYKTVKNPTLIDDIIPNIQIGDILIDSYHVVLIYDLVKDNEGKVIDAIIMDSFSGMGKSYVNTKIYRGSLPYLLKNHFLEVIYI